MKITFNIPYAFNPQSTEVDNARALRALLDCLVAINVAFLKTHRVPSLYQSGVRYGRTTLWEAIPALYARGRGDCKSLTCALAAEYQMRGIECRPAFRFRKRVPGAEFSERDFHILLEVPRSISPTGWEDPSKKLGMNSGDPLAHTFWDTFGGEKLRGILPWNW